MTTREQASGAGFTEDGVEFYPLTLLSYDKLAIWMQHEARRQVIEEAREEGLQGELLRVYMDTGLRQAQQLSIGTPEGIRLVGSYDGMVKLLEIASHGKFNPSKVANKLGCSVAAPTNGFIKCLDALVDRVYGLTKEEAKEDESKSEKGSNEEPDPTKTPKK